MTSRRNFLKFAASISATTVLPIPSMALNRVWEKRKFTLCLNAGNIGVKASQQELLQMAETHGFEAISVYPAALAEFKPDEIKAFTDQMKSKNIKWGSAGLPVDFRKDNNTFMQGIEPLASYAKAMKLAGADRMNTWILSFDGNLTYLQNFKQHVSRLREIAGVLGSEGVRLGLEYVGPRTLQAVGKFSFIRTMAETKELIAEINEPNVGFVLDSFHWYCAEETKEDLLSLSNSDIVAVDLNDARAGFSAAEQIDGKRELPSATGVIDLKSFLSALVSIGYDGPVRAEPFNQRLRDMNDHDALQATYRSMKSSFDLVE